MEINWDSPEIKEILVYEEHGCYNNPIRWILRRFLHVIKKADCQVFFEGQSFTEFKNEEKIYGVLNQKYFFSPQSLYIKENDSIAHIPWASIIKCKQLPKKTSSPQEPSLTELTLQNKKKVIINCTELRSAGKLGDIEALFYEMVHYFNSIPKKIIKCRYKGPSHLQQIVKDVPKDSRDLLFYKDTNELLWQKKIICTCGSSDHFHISTHKDAEDNSFDDSMLTCNQCQKTYLLFSSDQHGWNALCDMEELKKLPNSRSESYFDTSFNCTCGSSLFSILGEVEYSASDEIQGMKRSLKKIFGKEEAERLATYAFGNFESTAICKNCQKSHHFLSCECA